MKKIPFIALAIILTTLAISCGKKDYTIEGVYTAPDGTEVYLIDLQQQDTLAVTTVSDGSFVFTGTIAEPTYAYVGCMKDRIRIILEPGTIKADLNERTAAGTPMHDAYMAFHKQFYGIKQQKGEDRAAVNARKAALAHSVVKANPDNWVGALVLEDMVYVDEDLFLEDHAAVSDAVRNARPVRDAYEAVQVRHKSAPGQPFIDYLVEGGNLDGSHVRLSDYVGKGKYILLDHWASWCGPCKAEMPYIKKVWQAFAGDRFDVVSIAVSDKREDTMKALAKLDMPWHQILEGGRIPQELYGVSSIPHLILFAPDGTILKRGLRGEEIYTAVAEALQE